MREILIAKLQSCADYVAALRDSGTKQLIEGSMDLYWGCGQISHLVVTTHPYYLPGKNCLGIIHSEIRHFVPNGQNPPDIPIIPIPQDDGKVTDGTKDDSTSSDTNAATDGATGSSTSHPDNTECSPMDEETTSQTEDGLTGTSPDVTPTTNQPGNISTTSLPDGTTSIISPDGTSSDSKPTSDSSTNKSTHLEVPDDIKDTTSDASTSGSVMVTPHSDVRSEGVRQARNECTDYTVDNISKLCSTSRAKVDSISIAQEIEEVETPRRRFMKTTSVKYKNIVTPVQRGPIDSFFNSVKRKLSPEKDQDAGWSEQKQVRSETTKI